MTDPSGTTSFKYDQRGNVVETTQVVDSNSYTIKRSYDSLNRITSLTYPDNETVSYTYDFAGNLKAVGGYVTDIQYNAFGQRELMVLGNGVVTDYSYNPNHFRLSQIYTCKSGGADLLKLSYSYDNVGNVSGIVDHLNLANNQTFVYDHLNRLTGATGPYGAGGAQATLTYAYNRIGNMTCNSQISPCSDISPNYTYPVSGANSVRPHAVTGAGSYTYTYDPNGNMLTGAGRTFAYDAENRLASITVGSGSTQMVYDYSGERVKKTEPGGATTTYIGDLVDCTASGCTKYYFAGNTRIALKDPYGQVYYYQQDHLGSSTVVTNSSGTSVQMLAYYPYGWTRVNTGSVNVHHKFTGQELDESTALYYYGARYYDPVIGRFISADSLTFRSPQKLNRYSYVLNNPIRYIDPSEHIVYGACTGMSSCYFPRMAERAVLRACRSCSASCPSFLMTSPLSTVVKIGLMTEGLARPACCQE